MTAQSKLAAEEASAAARALMARKPVLRHCTKLPAAEPVNIARLEEPTAAAAVAEAAAEEVVPEKLMASAIASGKKKRDRGGHSEKKSKKLKRTVCFEGFGTAELAALGNKEVAESLGNVLKVVIGL